jgi:thiosulfate/3-mercaptopyruvate sulfurtransferase
MPQAYQFPDAIISAEQLAARLDDPSLRVFDCTVYLRAENPNDAYRVVSGRADYESGHIPGAAFLDLQDDLSDPDAALRFTMPGAEELAAMFASRGVGSDYSVVLYSRENLQWATRVWWMLRAIGFDQAAILDGGWEHWAAQGLPQRTGDESFPAATLSAAPRDGLFVDKAAVQAAQDQDNAVVINALSRELHAGHSPRYGRPGRIPGSINVPATELRDSRSGCLVPAVDAQARFTDLKVDPGKRVVIYCGGGIAATLDAFVLHQLGYSDVSVYDNSLNEWARDNTLPMESDPAA